MKNLTVIFTSIFLVVVAACQPASVVDSETAMPSNQSNGNKAGNAQAMVADASPSPSTRAPVEIKSKYPLLWGTTVTADDFKNTENPLELFSYDENQYEKPADENSPYFQARSGIEVDLMNCGGYLASGRIYSSNENSNFPPPNWRLKIEPATIAKDFAAKIKKCSFYAAEQVAEGEKFTSKVFAVAPQKSSRKNSSVGETDTKKIFRALPKDLQNSLNDKSAIAAGRTAGDLSLQQDNWTDLDGDKRIDLLDVSIPNEKQTSGVILLLLEGKWTVIADIQPA